MFIAPEVAPSTSSAASRDPQCTVVFDSAKVTLSVEFSMFHRHTHTHTISQTVIYFLSTHSLFFNNCVGVVGGSVGGVCGVSG